MTTDTRAPPRANCEIAKRARRRPKPSWQKGLHKNRTLQHKWARFYDANIGKWTSQDPLGFGAGDANLYRYVKNQSTTYRDPNGLVQFWWHFSRGNDDKNELPYETAKIKITLDVVNGKTKDAVKIKLKYKAVFSTNDLASADIGKKHSIQAFVNNYPRGRKGIGPVRFESNVNIIAPRGGWLQKVLDFGEVIMEPKYFSLGDGGFGAPTCQFHRYETVGAGATLITKETFKNDGINTGNMFRQKFVFRIDKYPNGALKALLRLSEYPYRVRPEIGFTQEMVDNKRRPESMLKLIGLSKNAGSGSTPIQTHFLDERFFWFLQNWVPR